MSFMKYSLQKGLLLNMALITVKWIPDCISYDLV